MSEMQSSKQKICCFSSWNFSSHHCQVEMNGKNLPHVHGANKSNFKEEKEEHKQINEV